MPPPSPEPDDDLLLETDEEAGSDEGAGGRTLARRTFFGALIAGAMGGAAYAAEGAGRDEARIALRPPGSLPEQEFGETCVRCFRCGNACPNQCIEFHSVGAGLSKMFTPYIHARSRGCVLCGECANVCPTGAIRPFEITEEGWLARVDMGKARVNRDLCYSFHGRTCGACFRACPLAGRALTLGLYETPIVDPDYCVGCGLCEQACLHLPQAIRIIPTRRTS